MPLYSASSSTTLFRDQARDFVRTRLCPTYGATQTRSIFVDAHRFNVTVNLYAALSRLRGHTFERILWVDAVCINQDCEQEKERQIQEMAKIYAQTNRVIVWLGETANGSDLALEKICTSARNDSTNSPSDETAQRAILALLQRP